MIHTNRIRTAQCLRCGKQIVLNVLCSDDPEAPDLVKPATFDVWLGMSGPWEDGTWRWLTLRSHECGVAFFNDAERPS